MKDYTKLAKEFSKKGVRLNSNLDSFLIALQNAKEPNEDPISQWDAIRILQTMVWLEWCHTFGLTIVLDVDAIIDEESFKEEMKLRGYNPTLGLSMHEAVRENLNNEGNNAKEPKGNISGDDLRTGSISNGASLLPKESEGTDSVSNANGKPIEAKGEAQDGSSKSG
ncbi:hypothetical protein [Leptospira terpstrae]|uniref:Uncharacterized protein n=1 Tax=Leptospira terpstrae serovar Hualin str. LT 11-33 = ATCC 700639 TaxID=1257025 RepID=N1VZ00_9LEPT|nr:hypothetical protein [Leptospira terpstrae]EMY61977.1 hypothetical protein LEP1GSC203_3861 [Leptospira terpstrae serovar Hualin str. LT 11-33 = ATCC 700639]